MPRLLVDLSAHGYGHLGQTAPVLNALHALVPDLEVVVRSGLPLERLETRIAIPFRHIRAATDFGYVMRNAVDLDLPATAQAYRSLHERWDDAVAGESDWLGEQAFDAVVSNVSYLPLAGAARAGLPSAALCSLNWLDLFVDNFGDEPWAAPIRAQMADAYGSARMFLRISPGLPMASLRNLRIVGPICRIARADRTAVARQLGVPPGERWLLVAMGGIDFPLDLRRWPALEGVRYLVPPPLQAAREDVTVFDSTRLDFTELLASSDVVITKPGYGTFVEAACHCRPVLYLEREGWAESRFLIEWLHANTRAAPIARSELADGRFMETVDRLLAAPTPAVPQPTGIGDAARLLRDVVMGER